jgi:carbonic anhydrase
MLLTRKFLSVAIALGMFATAGAAIAADDHGPSWGYDGKAGASNWGDLKPEYATCKLGLNQSPIDIKGAEAAELDAIKFDYKTSPLKIIDNGHTIQANYASGSSITVNGKQYNLIQVHFHQPSEEKVDGKAYPMDAHLVHKSEDGKLAVVAVLLNEGKRNQFLQTLWKNIPKQKKQEVSVKNVNINLAKLLPTKQGYYSFAGSLTTPPCSEEVTWMVLNTPVEMSKAQIAKFGSYYSNNARPVQPLNDRSLKVSK